VAKISDYCIERSISGLVLDVRQDIRLSSLSVCRLRQILALKLSQPGRYCTERYSVQNLSANFYFTLPFLPLWKEWVIVFNSRAG
jgi:hypothetical protein